MEMATHTRILVWEITQTEEPGGLQSMGSQRVGHGLATKQELAGQFPLMKSTSQAFSLPRSHTFGHHTLIPVAWGQVPNNG